MPQDHQLFTSLTQAVAEGKQTEMCLSFSFFFLRLSVVISTTYSLFLSWCLSFTVLAPGVVMEDPYWQCFMEQAVRLIYFLAESPDQLCSRLLQRSARLLLDQIAEGDEVNKDISQMQDGSQETNEQSEQGRSRCLFGG